LTVALCFPRPIKACAAPAAAPQLFPEGINHFVCVCGKVLSNTHINENGILFAPFVPLVVDVYGHLEFSSHIRSHQFLEFFYNVVVSCCGTLVRIPFVVKKSNYLFAFASLSDIIKCSVVGPFYAFSHESSPSTLQRETEVTGIQL